MVLAGICIPFNWLRIALLALMTVGFVGAVLLFPGLFFLVPLGSAGMTALACMLGAGAVILLGTSFATHRIWKQEK